MPVYKAFTTNQEQELRFFYSPDNYFLIPDHVIARHVRETDERATCSRVRFADSFHFYAALRQ